MTRAVSPRIARLRQALIGMVPVDKPSFRPALEALPFPRAMITYLNWVDRFVPPRPRRVEYSDGFWESDAAMRSRPEVSRIVREVAAGGDLAPYLSKRAEHKGFAPAKYDGGGRLISSKWRDKDFALNAYGVHHMHLEPARVDECANSSGALLFVEFNRDHARLVMVGDHDSFDSQELEAAVLKSRLGSSFELKGILGPRDGCRAVTRHKSGMSSPAQGFARSPRSEVARLSHLPSRRLGSQTA